MLPIEKVVRFIQLSTVKMARMQRSLNNQKTAASKIEARVPAVVDTLIKTGYAQETDRTKLASALHDPLQALEVLVNATQVETETIGTPTHLSKQANEVVRSPYCDRPSAGERPRDVAFRQSVLGR